VKKELIQGRSWPSKAELRTEVFEYIEVFFNRRRRHSTLGYLSPEQFENQKTREIEMIKPTAAAAA
jgi:putative transposase